MKSLVLLLCGLLCLPVLAADKVALAKVESVYLLSMGSGLDQFLAVRLTAGDVFQVVADPRKADAVFTERIGEAFEQRLKELYPEPSAASAEAAEAASEEPTAEEEQPVRPSTFGRGKGTLFLVDTKSRNVIWSTYELPKDSSGKEMDRIAGRIVKRLQDDLKEK